MREPKSQCDKCGAVILQSTAQRTSGLCMPCAQQGRYRPTPKAPLQLTCSVRSDVNPEPLFSALAQDILVGLEAAQPIGDASHPNTLELEAQRALVRHAIRHGVPFKLHDDHWRRTGYVLVELFDRGKATMEVEGKRFRVSDVTKEDWREGTHPMRSCGGFLYRDSSGIVLFKRWTWKS